MPFVLLETLYLLKYEIFCDPLAISYILKDDALLKNNNIIMTWDIKKIIFAAPKLTEL